MRIGIDARMFQLGGFGIARYVQKLLEHLEQREDEHEYVVFLLRTQMKNYVPTHPRFRTVCADVPWYSFLEQIKMPLLLLKENLDLVHFPHFNVPLLYPKPFVVTIHDLIMLNHPLSATSAVTTRTPLIHFLKHATLRFIIKQAMRRARHIITVSEYVKKQLISRYHLSQDAVTVIYEAADSLSEGPLQELPSNIRRPYLLSVGSSYPHKNLGVLLDAWPRVQLEHPDLSLYFCGQEDVFTARLRGEIEARGLGATVRHLGSVTDGVLKSLYKNAELTLSPSLEEGFGLTPLESLKHQSPVLVSDIPVFHEIFGDAALYFDPHSPDDILKKINRLLVSPQMRHDLLMRGEVLVDRYSWELCVAQTQNVYHSALS